MGTEQFVERLKKAIGNRSLRGFSGAAGISASVLRQYLGGRSEPTRPALIAIARTAGVSLQWLATGEEPWQENGSPSVAGESLGNKGVRKDYILGPQLEEFAHPAMRVIKSSKLLVDYLAVKSDWIERELTADPESVALMCPQGDAMDPTVRTGDLVLLDLSQNQVRDDGIYALQLNDELVLRRVQTLMDGTAVICSDNPIYQKQEIPKNSAVSLDVIGRMIWKGRRV